MRPSLTESWKYSDYFGWSTSRIYNGSNEDLPLDPNWNEYSFNPGTWSHLDALSKNPQSIPLISGNKEKKKNKSLLIKPISSQELTTNLFNASSFATHFMLKYLSNSGLGRSNYKNSSLTGKYRKTPMLNNGYSDQKLIKGKRWKNFLSRINIPI